MNLASFKDILSVVSNLAMKGCLFLGEIPVWLAETEVADLVSLYIEQAFFIQLNPQKLQIPAI